MYTPTYVPLISFSPSLSLSLSHSLSLSFSLSLSLSFSYSYIYIYVYILSFVWVLINSFLSILPLMLLSSFSISIIEAMSRIQTKPVSNIKIILFRNILELLETERIVLYFLQEKKRQFVTLSFPNVSKHSSIFSSPNLLSICDWLVDWLIDSNSISSRLLLFHV